MATKDGKNTMKKTSTRFIGGPLYYPEQQYPRPNNHLVGSVIAIWGMVSMWLFPFAGWFDGSPLSFLIVLIIHTIPFVMDYFWSDATMYNIRRLNYHGYSTPVIFANMFINHVGGVVPFFMVARQERQKFPKDFTLIPLDEPLSGFFFRCLIQLMIAAVMSDLGFYLVHSCLHRYWPSLHRMHHVNVRPSLITAIIIHPLDIFLSGMPVALSPLILYQFFGDISMRILLHPFLGSIYHISHDEWLAMPHAKHHTHLNTHYWAYYNSVDPHSRPDRLDQVRSMVLKHEIPVNAAKDDSQPMKKED